jgi:3-oxoadipate enol-lactonase
VKIIRHTGTLVRPDCTVFYEVTGEGPAIIFAHGLGGNHMSWFQQVAHFAPRFTCVAIAHRGFAPSSPIEGGPNPADYAGDMAALVDHLKLDDVRIVAQSMGGWTAVEYALTRSGALKAIVLAGTTGTADPFAIGEPYRTGQNEWLKANATRAADLFARGVHPAAGERMVREQPALHHLYRQIDDQNAHWDKEALRLRLMAARTRKPQELREIACPTLFIAGAEDPLLPPVAIEGVAAAIPGARVAHIEKAGHSAYFERAAEFNRIVDDFLAGK